MNTQRAAEIQAVLEGVRLPASRSDLIAYAREQAPMLAHELEGLPDEEFRRLDDVGKLLLQSPPAPKDDDVQPRQESEEPPGGPDYLIPFPADTGRVRDDAPPDNPPQKAIEQASAKQQEQLSDS